MKTSQKSAHKHGFSTIVSQGGHLSRVAPRGKGHALGVGDLASGAATSLAVSLDRCSFCPFACFLFCALKGLVLKDLEFQVGSFWVFPCAMFTRCSQPGIEMAKLYPLSTFGRIRGTMKERRHEESLRLTQTWGRRKLKRGK